MSLLPRDLPWVRVLLFAALAVDLSLLTVLRGADVQTPWVLWALLIVLGPAFAELLRRWRARALAPLVPALLLLCWLCLSDLTTGFPLLSLAQTGLVSHALLLAIVVARPWSSSERSVLLLLVSMLAFIYACWMGWIVQREGTGTGFARDANNVAQAAFLACMTMLGLLRARVGAGLWSGALLAGTVALLLAGPLHARAAVLILVTALALRLLVERDRIVAIWFGAAVCGALVAVLLPRILNPAAEGALAPAHSVMAAADSRAPMFQEAFELLREAPIQGHGLLSFAFLFDVSREPTLHERASMVHNDYLQLGLELGWPALIALCLLAAALLRVWILESRVTRTGSADRDTTLAGWLALALLGCFGHALINFPFYDAFLPAQFAIMATLAFRAVPLKLPLARPFATRMLALMGSGAAVLVTMRILVLTVAVVVFLRHPLLPGVATGSPSTARSIAVASALQRFDFLGGMPEFVLGQQLADAWASGGRQNRALAEAARDAFGAAAVAEPWIGEYSIQYARMQRETGTPLAERVRVLERALFWQSRDPRLFLALAVHRLRDGDRDGAVAVASRRWLPWCMHAPRVGAREHSDLLALAQLDPLPERAAEVAVCIDALRSSGYEPSQPEEVLARFTAAPAERP